MAENNTIKELDSDHAEKSGTCSYIYFSGKRCSEPKHENDTYCFWHSPDVKKGKLDIKSQLEEKSKKGDSLEGFHLEKTDLEDIYLIGADLRNANLKRANLDKGHLFNINLNGANLFKTDLSSSNLRGADLENADLLGVNLENAMLERVNWGVDFKVKSELEADKAKAQGDKKTEHKKYLEAEEIYRNIKTNFKNRGHTAEGGIFFYREMIMKRKQKPLFSSDRFWGKLIDMICGYGERPFKIITFSLMFILLNAVIFCFLGINGPSGRIHLSIHQSLWENLGVVYNAIYYSFVTFTTLGYGDYTPYGISKFIAIIEAYSGAFLMALFVITVYKSMMER